MRLLVGVLIVGLLIVVVSFVMGSKKGDYESDPSQWNRTIQRTSHTTTQESGERREYTGRTSYEQRDVVDSREVRTKVVGDAEGSLFGGVQQSYDSHANYCDGGEQEGSFKDDMTYRLRIKASDGTEHDVEGPFHSEE